MSPVQSLTVALGARSYPIHIGPGLLADASRWLPLLHGRHVLVVSDANVAQPYLARVQTESSGPTHAALVLTAGEPGKTLHRRPEERRVGEESVITVRFRR